MSREEASYVPATRSDGAASQEADQADGKTGPNPLLIVHSLLRGRYVLTFVLAAVAAAAGAAGGYLSAKPTYQSVGLIRIKPTIPSGTPSGRDDIMPAFGAFFASQIEFLSGERVIMNAMERPEWQQLQPGLTPQQIAAFKEELGILSPQGSELIRVAFTDKDPAVAMAAVKCVISSYIDIYGNSESDDGLERLKVYEKLRIDQGNRLLSLNMSIADIAGTDVDPDSIHKLYLLSLEETNTRESAWNEIRRLLAAHDVTETPAGAPGGSPTTRASDPTPEQIARTDRQMQSLLAERRKAQQAVTMARIRFLPKHPDVIEAQQRVEMIDEDIAAHARNFIAAWAVTPLGEETEGIERTAGDMMLHGLRVKERNLRALHEESALKTKTLGQKVVRIQALKREADAIGQALNDTKSAIGRLELQASFSGRISAISYGDKPLQPFEDKRMKLAAAGAFGGGALPVALMLAIGFLNRRFVSIDDARLGLHHVDRVLGVLPHVPGDLADAEQAAVAAHCVHHIRTLLQLEPGLPARRIYSVTSPSPGDGKTTLAIALGMSFAASGAKTLLLDCDIIGGGLSSKMEQMIRPKIGRVLRREGLLTDEQLQQALHVAKQSTRPIADVLVEMGYVSEADVAHAAAVQAQSYVGLLDVLDGEPLADCVTGTGRQGLFILPLGAADAHHVGQLSPVALNKILADARAAFEVVLIDTGPILGSLEAAMVAAQSDAVVLTLSRGVPQALVRKSLDRLQQVGAYVAGMVLNRAAEREVATFAFSSGSVRSVSSRRLPPPEGARVASDIRLGNVGDAVALSSAKPRS